MGILAPLHYKPSKNENLYENDYLRATYKILFAVIFYQIRDS